MFGRLYTEPPRPLEPHCTSICYLRKVVSLLTSILIVYKISFVKQKMYVIFKKINFKLLQIPTSRGFPSFPSIISIIYFLQF